MFRSGHFIILLVFVSVAGKLHGQPQHRHWFFGFGAGLDMGTSPPTAVPGPLSTDEGVASISDANGQLLFFTNGETVWDRDLAPMPNGTGLLGHFSSSQSALIVPFPGDPTMYHIFTTPAEAGVWTGNAFARHHVVDMALNAGRGDVVTKNQQLAGPVTEKLTAVRHANGRDIWVVYHGWDNSEYLAYLVTCEGVQGPVISTIGYHVGPDGMGYTNSAIGCMKLNRQGTKLASVWTDPVLSTQSEFRSWRIIEVLDFDNTTGVLSNVIADTVGSGTEIFKGYGVEFSPNGELVYASDHGLLNGISTASVHQYHISAPDPMGTGVVVGSGFVAHGTMQLAPNGSIYIARLNGATYLSAITNPNVVGSGCGYVDNAVSLGGSLSTWGLPNHWDTYTTPTPEDLIALRDTSICGPGINLTLEARYEHPFDVPTYLWSTGATTASITVNAAGVYHVEIQLPCRTIRDSVTVVVGGIPVDLGPDISLCEGQEVMLAAGNEDVDVQWSTGETTPAILVDRSGSIGATVIDELGCITQDEVLIEMRDCTCPFYLPNAFTPNDDGINDVFAAVHNCTLVDYRISLFDRWGDQVFSTDIPETTWDGSVGGLPPVTGVYPWVLQYSWDDGERIRQVERSGHVTVVR